jgi:hypothetical protein
MLPPLIEHLERHLGPIDGGWSVSADGDPMPFQIARFRGGGPAEPIPFSTLGLSRFLLASAVSGKKVRQELLFLSPRDFGDRNIPAVLQNIAAEAVGLERAYLRGEVIGPRGRLFDGYLFTSLYVSIPVHQPDSFRSFTTGEGGSIVFAWLVPIFDPEAQYVRDHGWSRFEDMLVERDPDLVNFNRQPVV